MEKNSKIKLIDLFSEHRNCNKCFDNKLIKNNGNEFRTSDIKGPQPRWVGKNYFNSFIRICFILINPGSGNKTPNNEWSSLNMLDLKNTDEVRMSAWKDIMETNLRGMPNWGAWKKLYLDSFGLDEFFNVIAFVNWMLCAAKVEGKNGKFTNAYNKASLENCFSNVSNEAFKILDPNIVIFSGQTSIDAAVKDSIPLRERRKLSGTNSRKIPVDQLKNTVRDCFQDKTEFYYMGHYAYINSKDYEDANIIRNELGL